MRTRARMFLAFFCLCNLIAGQGEIFAQLVNVLYIIIIYCVIIYKQSKRGGGDMEQEKSKEKFIVRSVRGPQEAFDLLKQMGDEYFENQGEALAYLVNLYNIEEGRRKTGRETEIEEARSRGGCSPSARGLCGPACRTISCCPRGWCWRARSARWCSRSPLRCRPRT